MLVCGVDKGVNVGVEAYTVYECLYLDEISNRRESRLDEN